MIKRCVRYSAQLVGRIVQQLRKVDIGSQLVADPPKIHEPEWKEYLVFRDSPLTSVKSLFLGPHKKILSLSVVREVVSQKANF